MSEHTFKSSPDKGTPRTVQYKVYSLEIAIRDQKIEQAEQELKEARQKIESNQQNFRVMQDALNKQI